jgi:hypothetical protein
MWAQEVKGKDVWNDQYPLTIEHLIGVDDYPLIQG